MAESSIVYIDAAQGLDAGQCTHAAPCQTLAFAVSSTLPTRSHIVMAPGTYVGSTSINAMSTSATSITIHGGGAKVQPTPAGDIPSITVYDVATTLHDLDFPGNGAFAAAIQSGSAPCTAYRVTMENTGGIIAGSNLTIHDAMVADSITSTAITLNSASHVSMDRVVVSGGAKGIAAIQPGAVVNITNLLVYGGSGAGVDLPGTTGSIAFATVADTGLSGTTPRAFNCQSGLTVSSSIIWTPSGTPIGGGCALNTVIAGPSAVAGTQNVDPMFKDEVHRDYHILATSPAKDVVDTGPMTDFEGDSRPQGVRYDIGADEAPP